MISADMKHHGGETYLNATRQIHGRQMEHRVLAGIGIYLPFPGHHLPIRYIQYMDIRG